MKTNKKMHQGQAPSPSSTSYYRANYMDKMYTTANFPKKDSKSEFMDGRPSFLPSFSHVGLSTGFHNDTVPVNLPNGKMASSYVTENVSKIRKKIREVKAIDRMPCLFIDKNFDMMNKYLLDLDNTKREDAYKRNQRCNEASSSYLSFADSANGTTRPRSRPRTSPEMNRKGPRLMQSQQVQGMGEKGGGQGGGPGPESVCFDDVDDDDDRLMAGGVEDAFEPQHSQHTQNNQNNRDDQNNMNSLSTKSRIQTMKDSCVLKRRVAKEKVHTPPRKLAPYSTMTRFNSFFDEVLTEEKKIEHEKITNFNASVVDDEYQCIRRIGSPIQSKKSFNRRVFA